MRKPYMQLSATMAQQRWQIDLGSEGSREVFHPSSSEAISYSRMRRRRGILPSILKQGLFKKDIFPSTWPKQKQYFPLQKAFLKGYFP